MMDSLVQEYAPTVTVVIPTHNRARSLGDVLTALHAQRGDVSRLEVVVVDDGSSDDTLEYLRSRDWGLELQILSQPQSGVAAARNNGARAAQAPILIFIDDDVAPAPGFLLAHLDAHRGQGDCVVIGRLAPSADPEANPPGWWRWSEWQFDKQYQEILSGERPLNGMCLFAGNFSLPAALFRRVNGFDETASCCEDVELGLRLEREGARFALSLDAIGHHSGYRDFDSWQSRAYREGKWDSEELLKMRETQWLPNLVNDFRRRHALTRQIAARILGRPRLFSLTIGVLRQTANFFGLIGLTALERHAYGGIYDLTYWNGLCDGLGGFGLLQRYIRSPRILEAVA